MTKKAEEGRELRLCVVLKYFGGLADTTVFVNCCFDLSGLSGLVDTYLGFDYTTVCARTDTRLKSCMMVILATSG